jgi:hypothetical protein
MADGVSGIGSAPFNVGSDIHQQTQTRERIEAHLVEQRVAKSIGPTTRIWRRSGSRSWIWARVMIGLGPRLQRIGLRVRKST